ncbi:MAG: rod shape-determining protein MreD [Flavobacteriaceae bacterium]|nr:rod shape-determining protein MreD [Flavobacteriaceae bacterium]
MNNAFFKYGFLFVILILLQVAVFNNISLFGYAQPMFYILFIFLYPITQRKSLFLFLAFLLGLSIDFFSNSGGMNAAATLFIAYIRLPILKAISRKLEFDKDLFNFNNLTFNKQFSYLFILTFVHHFIIFQLSYFKFSALGLVLINTLFSSIFTFVLLLIYSGLFLKKTR